MSNTAVTHQCGVKIKKGAVCGRGESVGTHASKEGTKWKNKCINSQIFFPPASSGSPLESCPNRPLLFRGDHDMSRTDLLYAARNA